MTRKPTTERDPLARPAVLDLLREGSATLSEAAELAGTTRQLVAYWARTEGIDPMLTRAARLAKLWKQKRARIRRRSGRKSSG